MTISSGQQVRAQVNEIQNNLGRTELDRLSEIVSRRFEACFSSVDFWKSKKVALYRSMVSEFDLKWVEEFLRKTEAKIHYPRIYDKNLGLLEYAEVPSQGEIKFKKGPFGIEEPSPEYPSIDPKDLNVVFVPGVAFGLQGERIGKGAGFFDRFLPKAPDAIRISLAFDFQIFSQVEQQPWDQKLDWWVTESREFRSSLAESFLEGPILS